jgi:glutamine phosphoribosylpyrophosphate amidotransferase
MKVVFCCAGRRLVTVIRKPLCAASSASFPSQSVNQLLYDGLQLLQHRGQDAAGIVTMDGSMFHMHKQLGMVRDVFRTRDMRNLVGNSGIAHVRYPTAGSAPARPKRSRST